MVIYLKEDLTFHINSTDNRKLSAGYYTVINYQYCSRCSELLFSPRATFGKEVSDLIKEKELFVIYHKRQYYGVWRDECEIPKIYNGWFNL